VYINDVIGPLNLIDDYFRSFASLLTLIFRKVVYSRVWGEVE